MPILWAARGRFAALAAILVLPLSIAGCKPENKFVAPPPPKVIVAPATQQKITRYVEATGNLAPVNQVDLVARVSGFLQEIGYRDGDMVKQGTKLFVIEPRPYLNQLQEAQATQASAEAQLKQAEAEYARQSQLGKQDFASQSVVDQALAKRDAARASLQQATASSENAAIQYTYTQVNAPFDGAVSAHLVSIGEYVGGTTPTQLATIVQRDPIWVNFSLSEQDVQRIREAMAKRGVTVVVDTVPVEIGLQTDTGYPYQGLLNYVAPAVNASTGTLALRGQFKNPDNRLLPGYFVRVRLPLGRDIDAMLVPDVAIGSDQLGRYVLVVNDQNVVEQRRVTVSDLVGENRVVETGLKLGEKVIVTGIQRAVPGQKVAPEAAPAASAPTSPATGG
jgi:RND family efflux transporter MFP subunit